MPSLEKLGPKGLATELEKRERRLRQAIGAVYALAEHGQERFSDIVARVGKDHGAIVEYEAANEHERGAIVECYRRYGKAVTFDSLWVTFLRVTAVRK
jgi:DNA-binding PadR family transcriptional regulator